MKNFKSLDRTGIETALQQMASLNSPGPNGYVACLYQNHWGIVGYEVSQAIILSFLNGNLLDSSINFTYFALILWKTSPQIASDYRPIDLHLFNMLSLSK